MARKSAKLALAAAIAVTAALILALFAVPRVRDLADRRVEAAIDSLRETVYSASGLRLGYEYAAIVSTDHITIHGIELFREDADENFVLRRKVASVGDLSLEVDLWAAIAGNPAGFLKRIRIASLKVDLILPVDRSIYEKISAYLAEQAKRSGATELPVLDIEVADASIAVDAGGEGSFTSSIPSLGISTAPERIEAAASSLLIFASSPSLAGKELFLQASALKASSDASFAAISLAAALSGRYGEYAIADLPFTALVQDGVVEANVRSGQGLSMAVKYDMASGALSGELGLKEYRPDADLRGLSGTLAELGALRYGGAVNIRYESGRLGYEGALTVAGSAGQKVAGVDVGSATAQVSGSGDAAGLSAVKVSGKLGGYEAGYAGKLGYEGLSVEGTLRLAGGGQELTGLLKGEKGIYRLAVADGELAGFKVKGLSARADARGKVLALGLEGTIIAAGESLSVKATGRYGKNLSFSGNVRYRGTTYGLEGTYDGTLVKVKGSYGLEGEARIASGGKVTGSLRAKGLPLSLGEGMAYGDVAASFAYEDGGSWRVEGTELGLRYEGTGTYPKVRLGSFLATPGKVEAQSVEISGEGYGLKGSLKGSYGEHRLAGSGQFAGTGAFGGAAYVLEASLAEGKATVKVQADGYDLGAAGLKGYRAKALLEGSGELPVEALLRGEYGSLDGWALRGTVGVSEAQAAGAAKPAGLSLVDQPIVARKSGEGVEVTLAGVSGLSGKLRYDFASGAVSGELGLKEYRPDADLRGLSGTLAELGALRYGGAVNIRYESGRLGYEGALTVAGAAGQKVAGVDVGSATAQVSGSGDAAGLSAVKVSGKLGGYEAGYAGKLGYEGLSVEGALRLAGGGQELAGLLKGAKGAYGLEIAAGELSGVKVGKLQATIKDAGERYDLALSGDLGEGKLAVDGSLLKGNKGFEGWVQLKNLEVMGLLRVAKGLGLAVPELGLARAQVSGDVSVRSDYEKVSWSVSGLEGTIDTGRGTIGLRGSGIGDGSRYELKGLEAQFGGEKVTLKGTGHYGKEISFAGDAGYRGTTYGLEGTYDGTLVKVKGSYGLEGEAKIASGGKVTGSLRAKGLPLSLGEGMAYGDVAASFAYENGGSWRVEGTELGLRYEGTGTYPKVRLGSFLATPGKVEAQSVEISGEGYGLKGSLKGSYGEHRLAGSGQFAGTGAFGGAAYVLEASLAEGKATVKVQADGYDLGAAGLKGYRAKALLEGSGELPVEALLRGEYGSLDGWALRGTVGVSEAQAAGAAKPAGLSLVDQPIVARKSGEGVEVTLAGVSGLSGKLRYDFASGAVSGELGLKEYRPDADLRGLSGTLAELGALRYGGAVNIRYESGRLGYEGALTVAGAAGQKVAGVDVGSATAQVSGSGDAAGLSAVKVSGKLGGYEAGYAGKLGYEGLSVEGALRLAGGGQELAGLLKGAKGAYGLEIAAGELSGVKVGKLQATIKDAGERYDLALSGDLGEGKLAVDGSLLKGNKGFEGWVQLKNLEVMGLLRVAKGLGLAVPELGLARAQVSGDVSVRSDYEKVSWSVSGLEGTIDTGRGTIGLRGSGIGDGSRYELKGLEAQFGGEKVTLKGTGHYGKEISFAGDAGYRGTTYGLEGTYDGTLVKVKGSYGLEGEAKIASGGKVTGSLRAKGLPLSLGEGMAYGDVAASFAYENGGSWRVEGTELGLRYEGTGTYPKVRLGSFLATPGKVEAQSVEISGEGYGLVGAASLAYKNLLKDPSFSLSGTLKNAVNAAETYSIGATYALGLLDAKVGVAGLPVERYIAYAAKKDFKGVLEGTLSSQGKLDLANAGSDAMDFVKRLPPVTFDAKVVGGEFRAIPIKMSVSGSLEAGILKLASPKIEYLGHQFENVSATVFQDQRRIDLAFDYKTVVGRERFEAGVIAQATLNQPQPVPVPAVPGEGAVPGLAPPEPAGKPADSGISIDFSGKLTNIKYRETLATAWEFSGKYDNGSLSIEDDKGSLRGSLGADGAFELTLRDRFPISADVKGTMADNIVTATVDNLELDLKKVSPLLSLEKDKLKILDGLLSGSLSFKGPISDPEINGTLRLANASVISDQLITGKLGPFSTTIDFAGKNLEMSPTAVFLEQGLVSVSASALLDQWSLTDLKFNVASDKDSVINVSTKIAGITVIDAKAKVDLVLSLENDVLVADGSVFFERGQVMINPQGFLPAPGAEPPDPNALAYRIRASMTFGKQLEIYLPDNNIPLVRGFTTPGSALKLQYDSVSQEFSLDGKIDLRTGYVLYYLRNFFLKSGSIEFAENNAKFNPLITASAELRESNAVGTVKIMLDAEKSPLNDLQPRLSSVPFYTETELVSMMSGGVLAVDTSDDSLNLREAAIASSEFIPQLNIFKRFEQGVQKALGLDIVLIRSSFIQRWLLDLTKPATEANPEDPLARYLDQSELYVGKYITDSAFLHGGLKIKEDPLVSSSRLRLDSEFGIELESPLGLINWSITPSWDEGSFVTGQQLSLSWRYVY